MSENHADCGKCTWKGEWFEVHRETETRGKMSIDTLYCPECKNEGVIFRKGKLWTEEHSPNQ